jgi:glutamate synthase (NADPH/NADH) small chain
MRIPRHQMPAQDSAERIHNFDEVTRGFTQEMARKEALRCLECKDAPCVQGCPVNVQIPDFIAKIIENDMMGAVEIILQDNLLPAVCGRVCPQEAMCESLCVLGKKGKSVAIGSLERFSADSTMRQRKNLPVEKQADASGKRVAVIGSGPSSLACAGDLIRKGHGVTVFEALHAFGGVLMYGIPEFRLPKEVVSMEVNSLKRLGVRFEKNMAIGLTLTLDELLDREEYDAVFIGAGAGLPYFLGVPGEELIGIYSSNELLTRVNLMKAYQKDSHTPILDFVNKTVGVFGAGNTALDSARTALRLGAKNVFIIYRRTEAEMPARHEEVVHAIEEGIEFIFLAAPLEFKGKGDGWLAKVRLQRMQLGEPDESGRRRPNPIEGSEFSIDLDFAVIAIGNGTNPLLRKTKGLDFSKRGTLVVNPETLQTSRPQVFAGGDIVTGGATVISAMGAGRKAAASIDDFLAQ